MAENRKKFMARTKESAGDWMRGEDGSILWAIRQVFLFIKSVMNAVNDNLRSIFESRLEDKKEDKRDE